MNESFLHYLWQYQYFDRQDLKTTDGEPVKVFQVGHYNRNAGPDFLEAKIQIGAMAWAGSVEIHLKSSDYNLHHHQVDAAYNNVVLHVVWQHDREVSREDGSIMPTVALRDRVSKDLLKEYQKLVNSGFKIPCSKSFNRVKPLTIVSAIEQALIHRLELKSSWILSINNEVKGDWEETLYRVLLKNFGFKINQDAFITLSEVLPLKIIRKHLSNLKQIEALLFGMAGFLEQKRNDDYAEKLKKEFEFLAQKFGLYENRMSKSQWKFLRLRPANFPTMRIAQLAFVLKDATPLFDKLITTTDLSAIRKLFDAEVSGYWNSHYSFNKSSKKFHGGLGHDSIDNIIINSIAPTLAAYGKAMGEESFFNRALEWLQQVKPESNSIIRSWEELGVKPTHAFDSQGLIEQLNEFCKKRNCLNCAIGNFLLRP